MRDRRECSLNLVIAFSGPPCRKSILHYETTTIFRRAMRIVGFSLGSIGLFVSYVDKQKNMIPTLTDSPPPYVTGDRGARQSHRPHGWRFNRS